MKKLKEFIKGKQVDRKFNRLGQGHSLLDQGPPQQQSTSRPPQQRYEPPQQNQDSEERRRRAAEAIEKRLNQGNGGLTSSQKAIQMRAKLELEREQKRLAEQNPNLNDNMDDRSRSKSREPLQDEDSSILYTCDLLEDLALPKYQLCEAIETYLRAQIDEEPLDAAVLLLYSLNPQSRLDPAIQVMQKYLNNILSNPEEEKFRKIRTSNKVFQEKVAATNGAVDFLQAVGFAVQMIPNEQTGEQESYLVLNEPNVVQIQDALGELTSGNAVTLKLFRDPKVFYVDPSKPIPAPQVPPEFFELSREEVRAMQQRRIEEVEKLTTLRTRAMREADAAAGAGSQGGSAQYKYTLIRVLFPDNYILQGVFSVHESVLAVREFQRSYYIREKPFGLWTCSNRHTSLPMGGTYNGLLQCEQPSPYIFDCGPPKDR
ncbi:PUB domain-containing protein [Ditylenchus destructor]|uniref:PUB domain-containing protein n=1 Tax=Ditylenchus destructor TaxID=166010 RepID=A0AAD4MWE3_9BILA|nr:PUB domain-containing protein [Ditylenchus destructor]